MMLFAIWLTSTLAQGTDAFSLPKCKRLILSSPIKTAISSSRDGQYSNEGNWDNQGGNYADSNGQYDNSQYNSNIGYNQDGYYDNGPGNGSNQGYNQQQYQGEYGQGPNRGWREQYDNPPNVYSQRQRQQQPFDERGMYGGGYDQGGYGDGNYYDDQYPQGQYQRRGGYQGRDNYYDEFGEDNFYGRGRGYGPENKFGATNQQFGTENFRDQSPQQYGAPPPGGRRAPLSRGLQRRERNNRRDGPNRPPRPMDRRMGGSMMSPFGMFGMMDQMMGQMDQMMGQMFNSFGMMDEMMGAMSTEMQGELSVDSVLAEARECLMNDPQVNDLIGGGVDLGRPFSKSMQSAMVNGRNRSRLQLGVPIKGGGGTGRVNIMADDGGISRLEVDVGGRVITVPVGRRRRSGRGDIVDADVIDADVEY